MSKKYLIFGATGSIGSNLAQQMYDEKQDCHLIGRNEKELKEIATKLSYSYSVCDVLKLNFADKLFKDLAETEILGMAYCVGSIDLKPLRITRAKDFVSSYVLNLVAATDIIRTFQDNLKRNNGSIVMFSTVAAKKGFPNHSIISPAKAAVEGLTVALAAELAPHTRVNCIAPSLTESGMSESILSNENMKNAIASLHAIPKIGQADDHSKLASFLLGEKNAWITGQIFHVDGGRSTVRKKG